MIRLPKTETLNVQINPNNGLAAAYGVGGSAKTVRRTAENDSAAFAHSDELSKALASEEDVRDVAVNNASALINQSQYPPKEAIQRMASFLAANMSQGFV
jgi:hypothetical protein